MAFEKKFQDDKKPLKDGENVDLYSYFYFIILLILFQFLNLWRGMLPREGGGDQFPYPSVFESTVTGTDC